MLDEAPKQDSGAEASPKPKKKAANRRSMFKDPVVRRMGFVAGGLVIFYLMVIVSALVMGMLNTKLPKTAAERDLTLARTRVESGSTSERDWATYAQALMDARQYGRAQAIIDQAKRAKLADPRQRHLDLAQTRLYFAEGKYDQTIKAADAGMQVLKKQLKADKVAYQKTKKTTTLLALGYGENYYSMLAMKGMALEKLGKDKDVLKVINEYLEYKPRASDMLEWRGDVYVRLGEKSKAEADYKEARRYLGLDTKGIDAKLEKLGAN